MPFKTREELLAFRQNYYEPQPATRLAEIQAVGLNMYASRRKFIDTSHWQSKVDGTTSVDWDTLAKYPDFGGAYFKLGEPTARGVPGPNRADELENLKLWFDTAFASTYAALMKNKLWCSPYLFVNMGWPVDRTVGEKSFDTSHDPYGKTIEQHVNDLLTDINIWCILKQIKIGTGWTFDARVLKNCADLEYDKLVLDVEDVYLNSGKLIGDVWMGKTLDGLCRGLEYLMEHGYMKKREIWIYSSEWVLKTFGNLHLRTVCDRYPTINAGYYWNNDTRVTTWEQLSSYWLNMIPNNWHPGLFGEPILHQVAACFAIPEHLGRNGQYSALDVNVCNLSDTAFDTRNPEWVARRGAVVPPPVEPPPPEPVNNRRFVTVLGPTHNIRQGAGVVGIADVGDLTKGARLEVELLPGTVDGYQFAEITGGLYIALTGNVKAEEG